ncbi:bifunctional molybdenum cofactor biosynthesis protein MoaC/MoaB [Caldithrix abyssi]|uniref:Molybdenum cofactor biosynthesis protein C n=1 Tax=Caldithrix abyssi DSM 13497 TaxID=880073 RepID=H1XTX0_CALAY|nr:bifunctional molybdenum cofactor biosynthesis protein MoaC/MoaB [Caldithrix abyssi]APF18758.1 molybdenum cofactor biosynthesis protein MoaC [Caldithrix abyssi DSM 13497]EHO42737.1 molybdenum cofactor biosynthesis protein C [Caldithrix abyssi DSM 13497]
MIDVSPKFVTLRYAKASGVLFAQKETIQRVKNKTVPKGDVLQVARAAGILAAKKTADWIVFCHPIPIDWIEIHFELFEDRIQVFSEVKSVWKTGVEMEAITAVQGALMNMYDMLKPLDQQMYMTDIKLEGKRGGKSDFTDEFKGTIKAAVLVISDSTFAGQREDRSGKIISDFLKQQKIDVSVYEILPDDVSKIRERVKNLVDEEGIDLIFTTGGTGFGPKDFTPEAIKPLLEKEAPGIVEAIRRHGKERTPFAMLSREIAGLRKQSLIITLPGSSRGAEESLQAIFPGLLHAFPMIWGGKHDKQGRAVL